MKFPITISKLLAISLALATIAVASYITTAEAQNARVYSGTALAGFIPGQSLHCSMAYPLGVEEGSGPVRVQAYVYDSYGNLLSRTQSVELRRGQFHTFIIDWEELRVEGEAETRRAQVGIDFQFQVDASVPLISSEKLRATIETVDNRAGFSSSSGGDYYCGTVSVSGD